MQVLIAASRLIKVSLFVGCALVLPAIRATETVLVGADAEWRYYSSQTPPPAAPNSAWIEPYTDPSPIQAIPTLFPEFSL